MAYGPGDESVIKAGTGADFAGSIVGPAIGANALGATGLEVARDQFVGVYQESGVNTSAIGTAEFATLAYPVGSLSPSMCNQYPDLVGYDTVPLTQDLGFGWCGDAPMTYEVTGLPSGLTAGDDGIATGQFDTVGQSTVGVTATNPHGSLTASFNWSVYSLAKVAGECMDRKTLLDSVIAYADRYSDLEVIAQLDNILYYAEARMSRIMRNREMSTRVVIPAVDGKEWYSLPIDYAGMRDIHYTPVDGQTYSMEMLNPMQMNARNNAPTGLKKYYSIEANQLRVINGFGDGDMELLYYQRVPNLTEDTDCNWVLLNHPDIYRNAVLAEVEAFAKNDDRAAQFDAVLNRGFDEIAARDTKDRWSGTPLTMRAG